jgi:hypothetical protein
MRRTPRRSIRKACGARTRSSRLEHQIASNSPMSLGIPSVKSHLRASSPASCDAFGFRSSPTDPGRSGAGRVPGRTPGQAPAARRARNAGWRTGVAVAPPSAGSYDGEPDDGLPRSESFWKRRNVHRHVNRGVRRVSPRCNTPGAGSWARPRSSQAPPSPRRASGRALEQDVVRAEVLDTRARPPRDITFLHWPTLRVRHCGGIPM